MNRKELAVEIKRFLDTHAKHDASEPEAFNGPDPYQLETAMDYLNSDFPLSNLRIPFSEYGSGCYAPMFDKDAKKWHDSLIVEITKLYRNF